MAQMPASYLQEKVDDLRVTLASIDTANGLIELDSPDLNAWNRPRLADMVRNAQAIIDEINQWTGGTS